MNYEYDSKFRTALLLWIQLKPTEKWHTKHSDLKQFNPVNKYSIWIYAPFCKPCIFGISVTHPLMAEDEWHRCIKLSIWT